ncbi:MAG: ABC transporter ATP-binding protein [Rhizobacter sp.]|nr:ABC transporter ATP-binding protein [Chlorobiales bacterium]
MTLTATDLKQTFDRRVIFQRVSLSLTAPVSLAITGANGSGKSTLLKLLAGAITASAGTVTYHLDGELIERNRFLRHAGFTAPYLNLYGDLTGLENVRFALRMKGLAVDDAKLQTLFDDFRLGDAKTQLLKTYSSGMQQRTKVIAALAGNPKALFLDEPTAMLDAAGTALLWNHIDTLRSKLIIVVATNDDADLQHVEQTLRIETYKRI